ncbi:hypothetical protein RZS08_30785, partial [Arthrospira platensis SPKY1]|nr:hypothetical protein [Arthrospira platensis SPKY1]
MPWGERPRCVRPDFPPPPQSPTAMDDMTERETCQRLQVAVRLKRFLEEEALPGSGVEPAAFWSG